MVRRTLRLSVAGIVLRDSCGVGSPRVRARVAASRERGRVAVQRGVRPANVTDSLYQEPLLAALRAWSKTMLSPSSGW